MSIFENFEIVNNEIVNNKWLEWYHFGIPNEEGIWRKITRIAMLIFGHCLICTKLDGCYFVERKTPKFPQHKQCDCGKLNKNINEVKLKINTECDIKKFTDYIFANNNSKKYIFESWGYDINNSIELKQEMELQSKKQYSIGNYILKDLDKYGQRISIEVNLKGNIFYSGWLVCPEGKLKNITPFGGWVK